MAEPIPTVANSLGSWLIASWVSISLWSIEAVFAYRYFATYKRDHWLLRAGVAVCFLAGTATVLADCIGLYRIGIGHFGNVLVAIMPTSEMSCTPLMSGVCAVVGQTYLVRRYQKVSKNWILALIFEVLAVLGFCMTIWGFVSLIQLAHGQRNISYLRIAPKIVYAMIAGVDVLVSSALIIFLLKLRDTEIATTRRLVMRLILVAFESGAITSLLALSTLLAFVLHSRSQIAVPFSAATGFSQALCLLYNLNMRRVDGEGSSTALGGTSVYPMSKMGRSGFARSGINAGVTIHQETVIQEDDERFTADADEEKKMPVVASIPHVSYSV